ncbi:MAG: DUF7059 domain-containing protein [Actinomycetes bacterium]
MGSDVDSELHDLRRVREALLDASYTVDAVARLLGPEASGALLRAETVPAELATRTPPVAAERLATLVRLFALQLPVPVDAAAAALPLDAARALGLVEVASESCRATLDVRPYGEDSPGDGTAGDGTAEDGTPEDGTPEDGTAGDEAPWWVVSDLGTGLDGVDRELPGDHVLGIGGASLTLAQLVPRRPVQRALDVGTGCGVQALHLSRHARHVVATDVLPRALQLAGYGLGLSGVQADLRLGDLLAPVAGERFDLVVSNPPFVVSPPGAATHTYRDSGRDFDGVTAELVRDLPSVLTPATGTGGADGDGGEVGGVAVMLGNWLHRRGEPWQERVAGWLPEGVDAWVVEREVQDPTEYVSLWLRDSGERGSPRYRQRYEQWLQAFREAEVEAVGFGWVVLRATQGEPWRRLEEWPHAVEQPLGAEVSALLDRVAWLRRHPGESLLAARLLVPDHVRLEQVGRPGAEDPEHLVLRGARGMLRAAQASTAVAAVVGACDGSLPLGVLCDAVAEVLEVPVGAVRDEVVPEVRELVELGLLVPADEP